MAWFLGQKLVNAGHECVCVYGRNASLAGDLAAALHTIPVGAPEVVMAYAPELVILAVPDDVISEVASSFGQADITVLHTAGSVSLDTLGADTRHKAVFWPIYSIRKDRLPDHRNIPSLWEGNTLQARNVVRELACSVTDVSMEATFEQRRMMHLSAVITNNFTNHLLDICGHICADHKLPQSYLQPILSQTVANFGKVLLSDVQTGPAIRNDLHTIEAHVELLHDHPLWQDLYRAISKSISLSPRN